MGTERQMIERDRHDADDKACLLEPQPVTAGTLNTDTIYARGFEKVLFCILGGAASGADGTLDIVVHQCTAVNNGNTDAKHLAGLYGSKAITHITSGAYYATLNQKWLIEVDVEEMDVDAHFDYLFLEIITTNRDWLLAVEAVRSVASYEPVAQTYITEVVA